MISYIIYIYITHTLRLINRCNKKRNIERKVVSTWSNTLVRLVEFGHVFWKNF